MFFYFWSFAVNGAWYLHGFFICIFPQDRKKQQQHSTKALRFGPKTSSSLAPRVTFGSPLGGASGVQQAELHAFGGCLKGVFEQLRGPSVGSSFFKKMFSAFSSPFLCYFCFICVFLVFCWCFLGVFWMFFGWFSKAWPGEDQQSRHLHHRGDPTARRAAAVV